MSFGNIFGCKKNNLFTIIIIIIIIFLCFCNKNECNKAFNPCCGCDNKFGFQNNYLVPQNNNLLFILLIIGIIFLLGNNDDHDDDDAD